MRVSYVGVFWFLPTDWPSSARLAAELTLSPASTLVNDLRHPPRGHRAVWEGWAALGRRGLWRRRLPRVVLHADFDSFPRGQVCYNVLSLRSQVQLDWRINKPEFVDAVLSQFEIDPPRCLVRSDPAYASRQRVGWPNTHREPSLR
jgi:hypothetical protein